MTQITLCLLCFTSAFFGQSLSKGDFIITANYGYPNLETKRKEVLFNRQFDDPPAMVSGKWGHSYVNKNCSYLIRAEFAFSNAWSLGVAISYWDMDIIYTSDYIWSSSGNSHRYVSDSKYHLSSLNYGLRANYNFFVKEKITWFSGLTAGLSNKKIDSQQYADQKNTNDVSKFVFFTPGTGIYLAGTIGMRYFPIKYIGINLECGYDHGALVLCGLTAKINTKKRSEVNQPGKH